MLRNAKTKVLLSLFLIITLISTLSFAENETTAETQNNTEAITTETTNTANSVDTTSTTALEQAFKRMSTELVSAKLENVSTVEGKLDLSELGIVVTANTQVEIIVNGTTYNKDWNDIKESYDAENKTLDIRKIAEILGITSIKTNMQITINIK